MGGQHRWAPAYLAACHHIYFIVYYMYVSSLANKIVVVVVVVVAVYSYGPIYAVSLGSVSAVVLNNMCTISDAFEGKAHIFSDRPNWLPLMNLIYQERGMLRHRFVCFRELVCSTISGLLIRIDLTI